jgi:hypothetical protein
MNKQIGSDYIRSNFRPDDRVAVVVMKKSDAKPPDQRVATAQQVASDRFQSWLRYMNREKFEVYISMNTIKATSNGRRKSDIAEIRHVYLDLDKNGAAALRALREREDLPTPNHVLESSPGKYQVVWRVEQFDADHAEALMRRMVRELGADPAATDSTRVLRLPGLYNHKYAAPHFVTVENLTDEVYTPTKFPDYGTDEFTARSQGPSAVAVGERRPSAGGHSQSERDWAYAKRALERGDQPEAVIRAIATFRSDKPNPRYYAAHTVEKAAASLTRSSGRAQDGFSSER